LLHTVDRWNRFKTASKKREQKIGVGGRPGGGSSTTVDFDELSKASKKKAMLRKMGGRRETRGNLNRTYSSVRSEEGNSTDVFWSGKSKIGVLNM